jgi:hypothetical protein
MGKMPDYTLEGEDALPEPLQLNFIEAHTVASGTVVHVHRLHRGSNADLALRPARH